MTIGMTESQLDSLAQELKKRLGLTKFFARLGDSDNLEIAVVDHRDTDGLPVPGFIRCRVQNDDVPYRVVKSGLLGSYSTDAGTPVILGYDEKGKLAIENMDHDGIREYGGNPLIYNAGDRRISGFTSTDSLVPLLTGSVSENSGTTTNEIFIDVFRWVDKTNTVNWFQGATVDLSALVPGANLHRYVAVFLKTDTLTIQSIGSTTKPTITPLVEADKQECFDGRDAKTIPLSLWRLSNSQTTVKGSDKVEDLRPWLTPVDIPNTVNKTRTTAATYNVITSDQEIFANTDSNAVTVNLQAGVDDVQLRIINTGTNNANVTIVPNGADHLIGLNNGFVLLDGESIIITYDTIDGWY